MPHQPRIPFKGTIFFSVTTCIGLLLIGNRVESMTTSHAESLARLKQQVSTSDPMAEFEPIDLGSPEALEDQLEAYMPLAGLNLDELGQGPSLGDLVGAESATEEPVRHVLMSVEAVRAARAPGWSYPAFDMPAEGLHGPPATPLPRNVTFELVDVSGEPLVLESIEVFEQTVNGRPQVFPYRTEETEAGWTFGIRQLMTGMRAYFIVRGYRDGQALEGTLELARLSQDINVAGGRVMLEPVEPDLETVR